MDLVGEPLPLLPVVSPSPLHVGVVAIPYLLSYYLLLNDCTALHLPALMPACVAENSLPFPFSLQLALVTTYPAWEWQAWHASLFSCLCNMPSMASP